MARTALRLPEPWTVEGWKRLCRTVLSGCARFVAPAFRRIGRSVACLRRLSPKNIAGDRSTTSYHPWHLADLGGLECDLHPLSVGERSIYVLNAGATDKGSASPTSDSLSTSLTSLGEIVRLVAWDDATRGFYPEPTQRNSTRENNWLIVTGLPAVVGAPRVMDIVTRARYHGLRTGFVLRDILASGVHRCDTYPSGEFHAELLLADCVWVIGESDRARLVDVWRESLQASPQTMPPLIALPEEATAQASAISASITLVGTLGQAMGPIYYWVDDTVRCPFNSGIQRVTRQLASALLQSGARVIPVVWNRDNICLRPANGEELQCMSLWNGPPVDGWTAWEPLGTSPGGWFLMTELPLRHDSATHKRLLQQARGAGLRCGVVFYDTIPWKMRALYPQKFTAAHAAFLGHLADYDLIMPISRYSHRDLYEFFGATRPRNVALERRIKTVSLPGEFPECPRTVARSERDSLPVTFLAVGTVEPRKNHHALIEAFIIAAQASLVPMRLVIAGHGSSFDKHLPRDIEDQIACHSNIEWIRDADDRRLQELYKSCDITVYPSIEEGFGLPILESLWHGKPCICADFGSMREVATGGGCLMTDVRDPHAFADAIHALATTRELRARLSQEAMTRSVKTWRHYAMDVLSRMGECPPRFQPHANVSAGQSSEPCLQRASDQPVLSVCISTFNRCLWLDASLANWCRLHPIPIPGVELLVVDNASTDDTPSVVARYADRADLRYHRNPANIGMLGNLRETSLQAQGRHVWIVGDDDLILPGTVARVVAVLQSAPELPLVYLNYAYSRADTPPVVHELEAYLATATPITDPQPDRSGFVRELCALNENFFTAIYTCIFRKDHAVRAYCQDTGGEPFSSLQTCVPTTWYVLRTMMDERGHWLGSPQLVVNMNVSWIKYAPLWILERVPEVYDLAEYHGADPTAVDRWRRRTLRVLRRQLASIYSHEQESSARFDPVRAFGRFRHLPDFSALTPKLRRIYVAAWRRGHPRATVSPEVLFGDATAHPGEAKIGPGRAA